MREIKFRAWDELNKKFFYFTLKDLWVEGCETQLVELNDSKRLSLNTNFPYKNIMQYTGLKDKNGVEIYEGDIITFANGSHVIEVGNYYSENNIRIVEVLEDTCQLGWKGSGYTFCKKNCETIVEIIGNIYKNPELLED